MIFEDLKLKTQEITKNNCSITLTNVPNTLSETFANSVRRIAVSIIPTIAPVAFKLNNAKHEYDYVPGIKQHMIDIVKQISRVRLAINETTKDLDVIIGKIEKKGPVFSRDLKFEMENIILNDPDIFFCDSEENINLTIYFKIGHGFISKDENIYRIKIENEENPIFINTNYSPLDQISYEIENVNLDKFKIKEKLSIYYQTNSDNPHSALESFNYTIHLLAEFFHILKNELNLKNNLEFIDHAKPVEEINQHQKTSLESLNFNTRTIFLLNEYDIFDLETLLNKGRDFVKNIPKMNFKTMVEIDTILKNNGQTAWDYEDVQETE